MTGLMESDSVPFLEAMFGREAAGRRLGRKQESSLYLDNNENCPPIPEQTRAHAQLSVAASAA